MCFNSSSCSELPCFSRSFLMWISRAKVRKFFIGYFFLLDLVLIVRGLWREAAFLGLFAMTPLISKHRGWTHSLWAAFFIPLPFIILPMWYATCGLDNRLTLLPRRCYRQFEPSLYGRNLLWAIERFHIQLRLLSNACRKYKGK
jgi:hypothetical protein